MNQHEPTENWSELTCFFTTSIYFHVYDLLQSNVRCWVKAITTDPWIHGFHRPCHCSHLIICSHVWWNPHVCLFWYHDYHVMFPHPHFRIFRMFNLSSLAAPASRVMSPAFSVTMSRIIWVSDGMGQCWRTPKIGGLILENWGSPMVIWWYSKYC